MLLLLGELAEGGSHTDLTFLERNETQWMHASNLERRAVSLCIAPVALLYACNSGILGLGCKLCLMSRERVAVVLPVRHAKIELRLVSLIPHPRAQFFHRPGEIEQ